MTSFASLFYLRIKFLIFVGIISLSTLYAYGESSEYRPGELEKSANAVTLSVPSFSLEGVIPDPKPKNLARNSHYLISNENHHHQFYQTLLGQKGGVYLGVGSEQNYLLAGWAQADTIILMDFDQMVVDLHKLYRVMFLRSESPKDFLALWDDNPQMKKRIESWIVEVYGVRNEQVDGHANNVCGEVCKAVKKVYRISLAHRLVPRRLAWIQKQYQRLGTPTFLTDQGQYQHIRKLFQKNQVFMIRGDLSKTMLGQVAERLKKSSKMLRLLYLSNAERYFSYELEVRKNMQMLPFDSSGLVLRTWALQNEGNRYAYFVEKAAHFLAWLGQKGEANIRWLLRDYRRGIRAGKFGPFPYPLFFVQAPTIP